MKNLKLIVILFIFLPIFSFAQLKTVPDSLRCITPSQVTNHIEQAFLITHLKQTIHSKDESINRLFNEADLLRLTISSKDKIIDLNALQEVNLQKDINTLKQANKSLNRKIGVQRVLLYIIGSACLIELSYIGIIKLSIP